MTDPLDPADAPVAGPTEVDAALARHELGTTPRGWPMAAVLGTLVVSNVMANQVIPSWAYVPWNCSVALVLLVVAVRGDGCARDELGLEGRRVPDGLRWGGAVSAGLLGIYLVGMALPFTRDLFKDDRADITLAQLAWQTLVMVPLGTVLMEEIAFRGVLPAMFRKRFHRHANGPLRADLLAALLFGFWHVLPSWNVNEVNPVFRDLLPGPLGRAAAITAGVIGTGAAGMGLSWLRNRSGSLLAPVMMHCSSNSLGYLLSWIVQH
ncbi:MAG: CPBP family intramembrane glutamic endopeptidase [Microthrixaceae bacterium]